MRCHYTPKRVAKIKEIKAPCIGKTVEEYNSYTL